MKKLLIFLKNYKKESVLAPLFKLFEAIFELIVPIIVAQIIDVGINNKNYKAIVTRCILLVLFAIIGMSVSITAQYFAAKAATGFGKEMRSSLFKKIQSLSFSELDTVGTSSLITRMTNDTTQVQNGVNLVLRLFLRSPFIVLGAMIMAFTINVKCAFIFLVTIVLLSVVIFGIMAITMPRYKNIQHQLDSITLMTRENYSGARVIRAFTAEDNEKELFVKKNEFLSHLQRSVGRVSALLNPVTYVVLNLAIIVLIYTGAIKVNSGALTQGQVVALYNYMSQILVELIKLASLIITVTKSFACASRIQSVFDINSSCEHNSENSLQSSAAVEFKDVSLRYKNASESSLSKISFSANEGEKIGIIGSTGSGKSSLVSMILHFYDAENGKVLVFGKDVKSYDDTTLRDKIGYVQQKAVLFKGTVKENILWGKTSATDEEVKIALQTAQVLDIVEEKGGLDSKVEQNGANFSGGQKQRLSVARALVRKPKILILDDSASALDFATEAKMRKAIFSLSYNPTVFIVSQRASSVMNADKILVLDDGNLVGAGTHEELLKNCSVYQEIFTSQFSEEAV